jgi:hypothetical protein
MFLVFSDKCRTSHAVRIASHLLVPFLLYSITEKASSAGRFVVFLCFNSESGVLVYHYAAYRMVFQSAHRTLTINRKNIIAKPNSGCTAKPNPTTHAQKSSLKIISKSITAILLVLLHHSTHRTEPLSA